MSEELVPEGQETPEELSVPFIGELAIGRNGKPRKAKPGDIVEFDWRSSTLRVVLISSDKSIKDYSIYEAEEIPEELPALVSGELAKGRNKKEIVEMLRRQGWIEKNVIQCIESIEAKQAAERYKKQRKIKPGDIVEFDSGNVTLRATVTSFDKSGKMATYRWWNPIEGKETTSTRFIETLRLANKSVRLIDAGGYAIVPEYRRKSKHTSDKWHFCQNCRNWPWSNVEQTGVDSFPATEKELCKECVNLWKKHKCVTGYEFDTSGQIDE